MGRIFYRNWKAVVISLFIAAMLCGCGATSTDELTAGGGGGGGTTTPPTTVAQVAAPTLNYPAQREEFYAPSVEFSWDQSIDPDTLAPYPEVTSYELQLARDPFFADIEFTLSFDPPTVGDTTTYTIDIDRADKVGTFYWRVRALTDNPLLPGLWSPNRSLVINGVDFKFAKEEGAVDVPANGFILLSALDNNRLPETTLGMLPYGSVKIFENGREVPPEASAGPDSIAYYEFFHAPLDDHRLDVNLVLDISASVVGDPFSPDSPLGDILDGAEDFVRTIYEQYGSYDVVIDFKIVKGFVDGDVVIDNSSLGLLLGDEAVRNQTIADQVVPNSSSPLLCTIVDELEDLRAKEEHFFENNYTVASSSSSIIRMEEAWDGALVLFTDGYNSAGNCTVDDVYAALDKSDQEIYAVLFDSANSSQEGRDELSSVVEDGGLKISGSDMTFEMPLVAANALDTLDPDHQIVSGLTSLDLGVAGYFYPVIGGDSLASDSVSGRVGAASYLDPNGGRFLLVGSPAVLELMNYDENTSTATNDNALFALQVLDWLGGDNGTVEQLNVKIIRSSGAVEFGQMVGAETSIPLDDVVRPITDSYLENVDVLVFHDFRGLLSPAEVDSIVNWARGGKGILFSGGEAGSQPVDDGVFSFGTVITAADQLYTDSGHIPYSVGSFTLGTQIPFTLTVGGARFAYANSGAVAAAGFEDPVTSARSAIFGTEAILENYGDADTAAFVNETLAWLSPSTNILVDDGDLSTNVLTNSLTDFSSGFSGTVTETSLPLDQTLLSSYGVLIIHNRLAPLTDNEIEAVSQWLFAGGALLVSGASESATDGGNSLRMLINGSDIHSLADVLRQSVMTLSEAFVEIADSLALSTQQYYQLLYCSSLRDGAADGELHMEVKNWAGVPGELDMIYETTNMTDYYVDDFFNFPMTCFDRAEAFKSAKYDRDGDGYYYVPGKFQDINDDPNDPLAPFMRGYGGDIPNDGIDNDGDGVDNVDGAEDGWVLTITEVANDCLGDGVSLSPPKDIYFNLTDNAGYLYGTFVMPTLYFNDGLISAERPAEWILEGDSTAGTFTIRPTGWANTTKWPEFTITGLLPGGWEGTYLQSYQWVPLPATQCSASGTWTLVPVTP
ncbi:MAG: hypothetical protein C0608_07895 [Deltaproteobacteria bacterium]|nr:MAG: hypothetical protein C0608_07895 [Deltaproteobacteria bacterium]